MRSEVIEMESHDDNMGLTRLEKIVPGTRWLRGYTGQHALTDLIAGITVGLTVLPQGLAYATLAGLEPQFGLYSAFMGGVVYALIGGCREVTIGPTALLSLMTSRHTGLGGVSGPHLAILLCFLGGLVELAMAVLRLGALVDLISLPVTVGFTSATALIIGASQLKSLFGLKGKSSDGFFGTIQFVVENIRSARIADTILGISSIVILLVLRRLKDIKTPQNATSGRRFVGGSLWLIATARNALLVLISSLIAYYAYTKGEEPFILTGKVKGGIPSFSPPPFSTTVVVNGTAVAWDFRQMVSELGASIALVPVIAVLGNVAISKAFGGSGIDATRELVALSLSNICGAFFSSYPVTGSFSRSAVNHASGVRTPIGGLYTTALILLALGVFTPYFRFIPRAALAAVIISAVIFMIEYEVVKPLWRCSRRELLPGAVTFALSLFWGVEIGLLVGVGSDLAFLVYRAARPTLAVAKERTPITGVDYILVRQRYSLLYFPAIEHVRSGIAKALKRHGAAPVVLDCRNIHEFDFTAARGFGALQKELQLKGVPLLLLEPSEDIRVVLREALNTNIVIVESESRLEVTLKDVLSDSGVPLLNAVDT